MVVDRNNLFITVKADDAAYLANKAVQNLKALAGCIDAQIPWPLPEESRPNYIDGPGADWYRVIHQNYQRFSGPAASDLGKAIRDGTLTNFVSSMKLLLSLAWTFTKISTPLPVDAVLCRLFYTDDITKDFTLGSVFHPKGFVSCTYKEEFINRWITKYEDSKHRHCLLILFLPRTFPVLSLSECGRRIYHSIQHTIISDKD